MGEQSHWSTVSSSVFCVIRKWCVLLFSSGSCLLAKIVNQLVTTRKLNKRHVIYALRTSEGKELCP